MDDLWSKEAVAERLKEYRNCLKLTQEKMAELLEISIQTYKNMESGKGNISNATLRKMKEKIAFSTDYLLFGEKGDVIEIWNKILTLNEREQLLLFVKLFCDSTTKCGPAALRKKEQKYLAVLEQLAEADKDEE